MVALHERSSGLPNSQAGPGEVAVVATMMPSTDPCHAVIEVGIVWLRPHGRGLKVVGVATAVIAITRTVNEDTASVLPDDSWNRG